MNTTTNYELNLPEGSDLFAPMTDYNPNFTKIDSAMAENRNAAVHSATEAIAGTVHSITRDEPDATMFRWTATGNFTSGDTFTVDGVSVTAIGANGQGLVTGAWLTGTEVLASLVGSVMTVYTSAASSDAETLEGHPASYFGTATAVAQAQSDATAAGTLANSAQTRADEAYNLASAAGGLKLTTVWTNPSPNSEFDGQLISFSGKPSNTQFYIVRMMNVDTNATSQTEINPLIIVEGSGTVEYKSSFNGWIGSRNFTLASNNNGLSVTRAIRYTSYGATSTTQNLLNFVPKEIIAVHY